MSPLTATDHKWRGGGSIEPRGRDREVGPDEPSEKWTFSMLLAKTFMFLHSERCCWSSAALQEGPPHIPADEKTCQKRFRSTGWTATRWPPRHPLPSCYWLPGRRWQRLGILTRPGRSCWITHGDATQLWMRRCWAGCRPWRRITCCCPSPTGSDTERAVGGAATVWVLVSGGCLEAFHRSIRVLDLTVSKENCHISPSASFQIEFCCLYKKTKADSMVTVFQERSRRRKLSRTAGKCSYFFPTPEMLVLFNQTVSVSLALGCNLYLLDEHNRNTVNWINFFWHTFHLP